MRRCPRALGPGQRRNQGGIAAACENGEDVFFLTADQLAPQDTDTQVDYYDAREDGGPKRISRKKQRPKPSQSRKTNSGQSQSLSRTPNGGENVYAV
jgi:hypothetical protein